MAPTRPATDAKSATVPQTPSQESAKGTRPPSNILPLNFDLLGIDTIKKELQKLSQTNQEILKAFQSRPAELPPAKPKEFGSSGNIVLPADAEDLAKYKKQADLLLKEREVLKREQEGLRKRVAEAEKENESLRKKAAELESKIKAGVPALMKEQQQEFEMLLDEKTETIRNLHMQNQELQEALRGGPTGPSPEQLDRRQAELEALEQRLLADEESLNKQAREMEMSMAKERADLARQRADLQRLHADVQREVELAARDPGLRERLMTLQRRSEGRPKTATSLPDINLGGSAGSPPTKIMKAPPTMQQRRPTTMNSIDLDAEEDKTPQRGGILRRLFGG